MDQRDYVEEALQSVWKAEEAVLEAQAKDNPQDFQNAHQHLALAQELVQKASTHSKEYNEQQNRQLLHAKEHLIHLLETQNAIQ